MVRRKTEANGRRRGEKEFHMEKFKVVEKAVFEKGTLPKINEEVLNRIYKIAVMAIGTIKKKVKEDRYWEAVEEKFLPKTEFISEGWLFHLSGVDVLHTGECEVRISGGKIVSEVLISEIRKSEGVLAAASVSDLWERKKAEGSTGVMVLSSWPCYEMSFDVRFRKRGYEPA